MTRPPIELESTPGLGRFVLIGLATGIAFLVIATLVFTFELGHLG
jgi:hypothetical protein